MKVDIDVDVNMDFDVDVDVWTLTFWASMVFVRLGLEEFDFLAGVEKSAQKKTKKTELVRLPVLLMSPSALNGWGRVGTCSGCSGSAIFVCGVGPEPLYLASPISIRKKPLYGLMIYQRRD